MRNAVLVWLALSASVLSSGCSAGSGADEASAGQGVQALNDNGKTITTYDQCVIGCVDAVDYCEKHQSSWLDCAQKGKECMEYCGDAFPQAGAGSPKGSVVGKPPKASADLGVSLDGIATSPLATARTLAGGNTNTGGGLPFTTGCKPQMNCQFDCDPPVDADDIFHCKLVCTQTWRCPP